MKKFTVLILGLSLFQLVPVSVYAYTPVPGDIIKVEASPAVFMVDDILQRIPVSAEAFAVRYQNNFGRIKIVTEAEWGGYTTFFIINQQLSHPSGGLIMYWQDPTIYLLEGGYKRGFATWEAFASRGYSLNNVELVGIYELYATGPVIN